MYTNVSLTKLSRAFESWCSYAWFQAFSKASSLLSWIQESDGRDGAERENIVNRTQPAKVIFIALSRIAMQSLTTFASTVKAKCSRGTCFHNGR